MSKTFDDLKSTWVALGREDPLWAVVSHEDKRGGKWNVAEFLATGQGDVTRYNALLEAARGRPPGQKWDQVLDFGCGVGRLSLAWSAHAGSVTGVDISHSMIEQGKTLVASAPNVRLLVNERPDLRAFRDGEFDLVFSHICLQHMPWELASGYLREFARVCRAGGWVAFQLPVRSLVSQTGALWRKKVIDALPFGLGAWYRRIKNRSGVAFEMHFTPRSAVEKIAASAGLVLKHAEPDRSAGDQTEGFVYLFQKTS